VRHKEHQNGVATKNTKRTKSAIPGGLCDLCGYLRGRISRQYRRRHRRPALSV